MESLKQILKSVSAEGLRRYPKTSDYRPDFPPPVHPWMLDVPSTRKQQLGREAHELEAELSPEQRAIPLFQAPAQREEPPRRAQRREKAFRPSGLHLRAKESESVFSRSSFVWGSGSECQKPPRVFGAAHLEDVLPLWHSASILPTVSAALCRGTAQ